jgi:IS4 transposase
LIGVWHQSKEQLDQNNIWFVTRIKYKTKYQIIKELPIIHNTVGNLTIIEHQIVQLNNTTTPLKLIKAINDEGKVLLFLTNLNDETTTTIIGIYKKRWDIEIFFRFLKQELNLSHLVSMNVNGITIILYVTLILSMLLLIYKQMNQIGYKTAKRRFRIQLDEYITALIVEDCGGDSRKWFSG